MKIKLLFLLFSSLFFASTILAENQSKNTVTPEALLQNLSQQLQLSPQEASVLSQKLKQIIQLRKLDQPVIDFKDVLNFATNTARDLFYFNYGTYEMALKKVRQNFSQESWDSYQRFMSKNDILKKVREKQSLVSAGLYSAPAALEVGNVNGIYTWKIQVPLLVNYENPNSKDTQRLLSIVTVSRAALAKQASGLIVSSLNIAPQ